MCTIHEKFILRTPRFSISEYFRTPDLRRLFTNPDFLEALQLASTSLYNALVKNTKGVNESLFRYATRSCFRSTPFGLFAGVSVVEWGDDTEIDLMTSKKRIQINIDVIVKIIDNLLLNPSVARSLKFTLNNSLYSIGQKARYIEWSLNNGKRNYCLSEVELTEEFLEVVRLSKDRVAFTDLIKGLENLHINNDDAENYLMDLIRNQVLISDLTPSITLLGCHLDELLFKLKNLPEIGEVRKTIANLEKIKDLMTSASKNHSLIDINTETSKVLSELRISCADPLRIDLFVNLKRNGVSKTIKENLEKGLNILLKLHKPKRNETLEKFIERFSERFGDQEVPLVLALDSDTGVGYPEPVDATINELTCGIVKREPSQQRKAMENLEVLLLKKLQSAASTNSMCIEITEDDLYGLNGGSLADLPSTFSIYFRVTDFTKNEILIDTIGGYNALQPVGRFSCIDDSIDVLIKDLSNLEKTIAGDSIIAEIVHLPENSFGNVVTHAPFYEFEINYLSRGQQSGVQTIYINDLFLKIVKGRIILFSKKLGKEIIPRLSNAHNYLLSPLSVYRFLCDLQSQGKETTISFSWGSLSEVFTFFPRVVSGNIILSPATWIFSKKDLTELITCDAGGVLSKCSQFRDRHKLPRYVAMVEDDQELFVDLENKYSIRAFLAIAGRQERLTVKEFLIDNNAPIRNESGEVFSNEFVAPVLNIKTEWKFDSVGQENVRFSQQRVFLPGTEWVYYKIYCSPRTMDNVLVTLRALIDDLIETRIIAKWFFVRYKDSSHHLRLRFKLTDLSHFHDLNNRFNVCLKELVHSGLIWNIKIDTYEREIERYHDIESSENLFYFSSSSILLFLGELKEVGLSENARWQAGLTLIDQLLDDFGCSIEEKHNLFKYLTKEFKAEFNVDKKMQLDIDKKYRHFKKDIDLALSSDALLRSIFIKRSTEQTLDIKRLSASMASTQLSDVLKSHIHMELNRLLPYPHRFQEMLIYDFMEKAYSSRIARERRTSNHFIAH